MTVGTSTVASFSYSQAGTAITNAKLKRPISPNDLRFYVGCNDDAIEPTIVGTEGTLT